MPLDLSIKKALVLGSGAIRIGQAGEFDYSGSQVLKALKEEGIYTILINPNIATIQTDPNLSDQVYLLPVTAEFVEDIIKKEHPDSILLSFGGQTALNVGVELHKKGILKKYGIRVLGTPIESIQNTEDRELFRKIMMECDVEICKSATATNKEEAEKIVLDIGYPVMIRVAYTLGGAGSGIAHNKEQFDALVDKALAQSVISQILVEEYVGGWKEIEYEVMRDKEDNTITVCNMENFDPCGIHTGESIVVAPSQTLTNEEYQMLRSASIRAIRHIGIIGECNIQYALHPTSKKYIAIEVNARLSRSSALASKATGYPLAYIAAKLALGYTLLELKNKVTNITTACFEPALDYVALKMPRWNLEKFQRVSRRIGTQMKSVGEVMGIGRTFEEAYQKSIRMLDIGMRGAVGNDLEKEWSELSRDALEHELNSPTDIRYLLIPVALRKGLSVDEIYALTKIDKWFLHKIEHILQIEKIMQNMPLDTENHIKSMVIAYAKRYGFSDGQICRYFDQESYEIRKFRHKAGIQPVVKQIDTLAAEWPANTNYLYMTYGGTTDDLDYSNAEQNNLNINGKKKVIVLGSGVYRIGSSVEFDWGCVNMAWALRELDVDEVIMINYNPETVSTDYDVSDKLYFEELSPERVLDICHKEYAQGLIVSVGGQIGNNLAQEFTKYKKAFDATGIKILGTLGKDIDKAENRMKFGKIMDSLGINQPRWAQLLEMEDALIFAKNVEYPVLVRPSYVLSGAAMRVATRESELREYLELAAVVSKENPVVITKFFTDAREIECDGVADGENVFIAGVVEHIENAGVHSGDATMSLPAPSLPYKMWEKIQHETRRIALAMGVQGPFNIQYLVREKKIYVIEMNLRSSRSMPYVSKTIGVNLIKLAAEVIMGGKIPKRLIKHSIPPYVCIKTPQFSFMRLEGADPILGVEMMSTGEVACIGEDFPDALIKSMMAAEFKVPLECGNILITVAGMELKQAISPFALRLEKLGFKIFATPHTADVFMDQGINVGILNKVSQEEIKPNIVDYILKRDLALVINIPLASNKIHSNQILEDEYLIRRKAIEFNIPVITNIQLVEALVEAIENLHDAGITSIEKYHEEVSIKSLSDYHQYLREIYW
ncbi:carbamoyl-phosphate synthase (glutamine-hydrolyzing) large subunit [Candidatus Lokiarchaeum ossiferum]|uniref:carbamoyl-phosphate synthase (glutamine-hydrolyzing) large subunit n=1 Tax=Candidatus Lokiarchaeum ossiferum TaxID=2951803 RepID=UPI00352EF405